LKGKRAKKRRRRAGSRSSRTQKSEELGQSFPLGKDVGQKRRVQIVRFIESKAIEVEQPTSSGGRLFLLGKLQGGTKGIETKPKKKGGKQSRTEKRSDSERSNRTRKKTWEEGGGHSDQDKLSM